MILNREKVVDTTFSKVLAIAGVLVGLGMIISAPMLFTHHLISMGAGIGLGVSGVVLISLALSRISQRGKVEEQIPEDDASTTSSSSSESSLISEIEEPDIAQIQQELEQRSREEVIEEVVEVLAPPLTKEAVRDVIFERLPCGGKHDMLVQSATLLEEREGVAMPIFFGLDHEQVYNLLSEETQAAWESINRQTWQRDLRALQGKIEQDMLHSTDFLQEWQQQLLTLFDGRKLMVRSSSNEDGVVVNAGGNLTVDGVEATEEAVKVALAKVVASYFSHSSFTKRIAAGDDPFATFPLCSVLIMEQISEGAEPITSGVMMTTRSGWSAPNEPGIVHIAASWGFGAGTSDATVCDEWVMTEQTCYPTLRHKLARAVAADQTVANPAKIRTQPALTDAQLTQLKTVGKAIERHFDKPMNVEFVVREGQIYIVQVRAIQAHRDPSASCTFLDPSTVPATLLQARGEMILYGTSEVLFLLSEEVLFQPNLSAAEKFYKEQHKAVVVYEHEAATTHPAVNFDSHQPPIPCFVIPYNQWKRFKDILLREEYFQLCPQTGLVIETRAPLQTQQGLFAHPARFPLSIEGEKPMQSRASHPDLIALKPLLEAVPAVVQTRIDTIEETFTSFFDQVAQKKGYAPSFDAAAVAMQKICFGEIKAMRSAAEAGHMMQLSFHAGVLRQLLQQANSQIVGAHSLSGLVPMLQLPETFDTFIKKHKETPLLTELALLGLEGFDHTVQRNWIAFLEANQRSTEQLTTLKGDLSELNQLELLTYWFAKHFSQEPSSLKKLLQANAKERTSNEALFTFGQAFAFLKERLERVAKVEDLEEIWSTLKEQTTHFITFYKQQDERSPLLVDLINLWDLSTKIVRTSGLYNKPDAIFKQRVDAMEAFAKEINTNGLLSVDIGDVLSSIRSWGSERAPFSVQHWLVPASHGALGRIQTDDQRLTVLHQNLLQGARTGKQEHLPSTLGKMSTIFARNLTCRAKRFFENGGTFISMGRDEAAVRINIPLNYHSTVVTLTQCKGSEEVSVMAYIRGSDNWRGQHLSFFQVFAHLTEMRLIETEIQNTDLRVTFEIRDEEQATLLSTAIDRVNAMSLFCVNNMEQMQDILNPDEDETENEAIKTRIVEYGWQTLKQTGRLFSFESRMNAMIWELLKGRSMHSEIIGHVKQEVAGTLPKSDFSKEFIKPVLSALPTEEAKAMLWEDMLGSQIISGYKLPKGLRKELFERLLEHDPKRLITYYPYGTCRKVIDPLVNVKLTGELKEAEAELLFAMALKNYSDLPESWSEALSRRSKEEINTFAEAHRCPFGLSNEKIDRLLQQI